MLCCSLRTEQGIPPSLAQALFEGPRGPAPGGEMKWASCYLRTEDLSVWHCWTGQIQIAATLRQMLKQTTAMPSDTIVLELLQEHNLLVLYLNKVSEATHYTGAHSILFIIKYYTNHSFSTSFQKSAYCYNSLASLHIGEYMRCKILLSARSQLWLMQCKQVKAV